MKIINTEILLNAMFNGIVIQRKALFRVEKKTASTLTEKKKLEAFWLKKKLVFGSF